MRNRYDLTRVRRVAPTRLAELRALAFKALAGPLDWRHHALGVLQAYLVEGERNEVRIHVWHPDLVRTNIAIDGGRPHDHRFNLRSTVLVGSVDHEELIVEHLPRDRAEMPEWIEYTVQHARKGAAPLAPTGRALRAHSNAGTIAAGHVYEFPAGAFHRSRIREPAVTLVTKLEQRAAPARVLFPPGCDPVFGVTSVEPNVVERFVGAARTALLAVDGEARRG